MGVFRHVFFWLSLFFIMISFSLRAQVQTGLDVLIQSNFEAIKGKSIGILTHQAAVNASGDHLLELMGTNRSFKIVAIFAPEHGFHGTLDRENIANSLEPKTGLTIYSLYGKNKKPTQEMLTGIELLVIDLQDIGTRFYTYQTTVFKALEACSENGVDVLILDRPNPIDGEKVAGPVLQKEHFSFTGSFEMPVIHGMTMGELAKMYQGEKALMLNLKVLRCKGWQRDQAFDKTGLIWVNPSPNMRRPMQAKLYPAIGLLEFTNLSVGRGTDTPFERIGAPWINPELFAQTLQRELKGELSLTPHFFTPTSGPYKNQKCGGIFVRIREWKTFDPIKTSFTIFRVLKTLYPNNYQTTKMHKLLGHSLVLSALEHNKPWPIIQAIYRPELERFLPIRKKYLLY